MSTRVTFASAGKRTSRKIRYLRALLISIPLMLTVLALAGCPQYYSNEEVITQSNAEKMPFANTDVTLNDGTKLHIAQVAGTNDYSFKGDDSSNDTGTLRFLHLRGDLFVMQRKKDGNDEAWSFSFYRIQAHDYQEIEPADSDDYFALASRYHVQIKLNDNADLFLYGTQSDTLAFLRAHKDFKFQKASKSVHVRKPPQN